MRRQKRPKGTTRAKRIFWAVFILAAIMLAGSVLFYFSKEAVVVRKPKIVIKPSKYKVAIVIDDWGYSRRNLKLLDSISTPLTLAVLPNLAFSTKIADSQYQHRSREIILHMPMEPERKTLKLERNTLLVSMDKKRAALLLTEALETVPYAKGISNHMGSKATKNRKLMKSIMEELKRRRLYFLDSVASSKTVCADEAKKAGVKCIGRDVFLDNILTKKDISAQIDLLIETARENGSAVGIGHDRPLTLNVIKERLDNLKDNDIKFVLVSELLKKT